MGDAVQKELKSTPIRIADGLDAVEVDADGAMAEWRRAVEAFDAESFHQGGSGVSFHHPCQSRFRRHALGHRERSYRVRLAW